mgnify:CR=1 FL=1
MNAKKLIIPLLLVLFCCMLGCRNNQHNKVNENVRDLSQIKDSGELVVLTLYSSTSYFNYRGQEMGFQYELSEQFAKSMGLKLRIEVANSVDELIRKLLAGEGDMIAYNLPITKEWKDSILYCGEDIITHQVIVQQGKSKSLKDVTELVGKDIYVKPGKYYDRLVNLNNELGGGIKIHLMNKDTIITEDLIEMVANGKIDYTLADNNIARLNKTYYNNIDIKLNISFPQRSAWAVRTNEPELAKAVDKWAENNTKSPKYKEILKRYFELSKNSPIPEVLSIKKGQISVYDPLFKKYAKEQGWDWRLIAAQAYHESRFDTSVVSWAGAKGLMQIMPRTARSNGLADKDIQNPEKNIATAIKIMASLDRSFSTIEDPQERMKFILASYNSGIGHVLDAIALTKKYGKDPQKWDGNVAEYILLKSNPEYFNDEVCKFGYFRGRETYSYVNKVLKLYEYYKSKIKA